MKHTSRSHAQLRRLIAAAGLLLLRSARSPRRRRPQTVDDIMKKGKLTVGMLVDFPPYGITNAQNKPDGYDADVARLLAKNGRQAETGAGHRPEPHPLPADQQGRPAGRLARRHARARQAGAVLRALRQHRHRACSRRKKADDQSRRRPEGPCASRVARASTQDIGADRGRAEGHRDHALRRRRVAPCRRCCPARSTRSAAQHRGRPQIEKTRARPTTRRSSCCSRQSNGRRPAPGPGRTAEPGSTNSSTRTRPTAS